jgi:hypothetical protein
VSFKALAWAVAQNPGSASEKLILLALADRHNEDSLIAYPSIAWLGEFSGLNRKTIIAVLDRLEAKGLISDSGERKGRTGQIKAYRLAFDLPQTEGSQKRNGSTFSSKGSQKRDTEPVTEPTPIIFSTPTLESNLKTQCKEKITPPQIQIIETPSCVSAETWLAWIDNRCVLKSSSKKVPFSTGIQQRMAKKLIGLDAQGFDAEKLLDRAVVNGWRDVNEPREWEREQFRKPIPKKPVRIERW